MKYLLVLSFIVLSVNVHAQQKKEHITVDGLNREFITYLPPGINPNDKLPVIISLHGRLGTAERQMKFANFKPIADRDKVIIVCPQGVDRSWNDGRETPAHRKNIDDVEFIDSLIRYITRTYNADNSRIYVTGMSNGGFMASRLAIDLNRYIAAIAVVGASMDKSTKFEPGLVMPAMYIQGTKDPLVPFEGGEMEKGGGGNIYGHKEILEKWAANDSCSKKPVITNMPVKIDDGTSVIREVYSNPNGLKVIGYTMVNAGHTWPGGSQYMPKFVIGSVSKNLDACEVIWQFFKSYRHEYVVYK